MAGRGRMRVSQPGVALLRPHGRGTLVLPSPPAPPPIIEQKLAAQHLEIQRLLTENQRLAASHITLRQEVGAAQHEIIQFRQIIPDKDAKILNLESDLEQSRADSKSLLLQIQQLSQELHRARLDAQQMNLVRAENEALRQELQRSRGGKLQQHATTTAATTTTTTSSDDILKEVDKLRSIAASVSSASTSNASLNQSCGSETWTTHYAPNGAIFYYNTVTGVTQWERPATLTSTAPAAAAVPAHNQVSSLQQTLQQLMLQQQQQQQYQPSHPSLAHQFTMFTAGGTTLGKAPAPAAAAALSAQSPLSFLPRDRSGAS